MQDATAVVAWIAAAPVALPPSALAALSAAVLLLMLDHRRANLGGRAAIAFAVASIAYGLIRSLSIRALSEAHLAGVPYRLGSPLVSVAGVPLQELIGWTAAVALAGYFADRLLRRFAQPTDAYRTALVAGLVLVATCLAVESAAVVGGWWSWNLAHPPESPIPFPGIALLDWGFVAIDFLLPFELWRRRAPLGVRLGGLLLFPLHLAGHAFTAPLFDALPLSGFDLVHVGLPALVAGFAAVTVEASPWPNLKAEALRLRPAFAVAILLGTAAAQLILAQEAGLLWTVLPLAAIALFVAARRKKEPRSRTAALVPAKGAALFLALLVAGSVLRLPAAFAARDFERLLRQGATDLVAGNSAAALPILRAALELRPGQSEALWLLGWAELENGERSLARRHLEAALAARPGSVEAARLLARLNSEESAAAPLPPPPRRPDPPAGPGLRR